MSNNLLIFSMNDSIVFNPFNYSQGLPFPLNAGGNVINNYKSNLVWQLLIYLSYSQHFICYITYEWAKSPEYLSLASLSNMLQCNTLAYYELWRKWSVVNTILDFCMEPSLFMLHNQLLLPGNPYWRGRLSTVDLLIKVACFVKK